MRNFVNLDEVAEDCDVIVTGEGSFDHSSLGGKVNNLFDIKAS